MLCFVGTPRLGKTKGDLRGEAIQEKEAVRVEERGGSGPRLKLCQLLHIRDIQGYTKGDSEIRKRGIVWG